MPYRFLPHTADLRVTIESGNFDELIADGVLLMRELLAGAAPVGPREMRPIRLPLEIGILSVSGTTSRGSSV